MAIESGGRASAIAPLVEPARRAGSLNPSRGVSGLLLAFCLAAQGIVLPALSSPGARIWATVLAISAAVWAYGVWSRGASPVPALMLVTTGFGGLGMLIGSGIDRGLLHDGTLASSYVPAGHAHHESIEAGRISEGHAHGTAAGHLWSWMGLGMLLFCVPSCALLCRSCPRRGSRRHWLELGVCTFGMVAGMWLGGALLPGLVQSSSFLSSSWVVEHLSMLGGMVAGSGAAFSVAFGRG